MEQNINFISCFGIFHAASAHTQTFKESLLQTSKGYSALINGSKSILAFSANSIPSLQFYWDEKRNKSQFLLDKTRQLPHFSPKKLGKDQYYCVPKNLGTMWTLKCGQQPTQQWTQGETREKEITNMALNSTNICIQIQTFYSLLLPQPS